MIRDTLRNSAARTAAVAAVLLACVVSWAQEGIMIQNFRVSPEFYPPPDERQMKFLLEGATASPAGPGRYRVTSAKLQSFEKNGKVEMVVETPECFYQEKSRTIDSSGKLQVRTADGGFVIEGEGFLWSQTNSTLLISNQVYTSVDPDLLGAGRNAASGSPGRIEIRSERFQYGTETGLGVYDGHVAVTGTNLSLTGDQLRVDLPMKEREIRELTAEHNVNIEFSGITARSEKAVFLTEADVLRLSGDPVWRAPQREGGADLITIERTNRIFRAEGNAFLKLLGESASAGFPALGKRVEAEAGQPSEKLVVIRSRDYEVRTNSAVFNEGVHLTSSEGGRAQGEMRCDRMQLAFVGTNQMQSMAADGHVVIQDATNRFTASKAFYEVARQELSLTGQPTWEAGGRQGRGDSLLVDVARNRLVADGNAYMKLPAGDLGGTGSMRGAKARSQPAKQVSTNQVAEVFSHDYELSSSNVLFRGAVRILHPQMNWQCDRILVTLSGKGGAADRILAEPKVTFDAVNEKGQKVYGSGDTAVYTRTVRSGVTNEIVELTGRPATLVATNGLAIHNRVLILDLASGRFVVPPGKYRILGPTNSVDTNAFTLPDAKSLFRKERGRTK